MPADAATPRDAAPPSDAGTPTGHAIIGTNGGIGWGTGASGVILAGHITWTRVEISASVTAALATAAGFHVFAIVGNTDAGTLLGGMDATAWGATVVAQLRANPGIEIAEAGNEMCYKGGRADPVAYGRMYLAAVNAEHAAGIHTPLLFNMFGDYQRTDGTWSQDAGGGGWLRDACAAVPGLAAAITANGVTSHPYGAVGMNEADDGGTAAVAAQEHVAQLVLGSVPVFYLTEFGYDLAHCGESSGACSQAEQASKMQAAYTIFLADAHVRGIWWYSSHDDGTGHWAT